MAIAPEPVRELEQEILAARAAFQAAAGLPPEHQRHIAAVATANVPAAAARAAAAGHAAQARALLDREAPYAAAQAAGASWGDVVARAVAALGPAPIAAPVAPPATDNGAGARLADPALAPDELARIATEHPALRPQAALHPAAYPGLLAWLAAFGDPATDAALRQRAATGPASPAPATAQPTVALPPVPAPPTAAPTVALPPVPAPPTAPSTVPPPPVPVPAPAASLPPVPPPPGAPGVPAAPAEWAPVVGSPNAAAAPAARAGGLARWVRAHPWPTAAIGAGTVVLVGALVLVLVTTLGHGTPEPVARPTHTAARTTAPETSAPTATATPTAGPTPTPTPTPAPVPTANVDVSGTTVSLPDLLSAGCPASPGDLLGVTPTPAAVVDCGDGTVASIDLTTRVLTFGTGFPTGSPAAPTDATAPATTTSSLVLAAGTVAWVDLTTTPAAGGGTPTWSATVHLRGLDGSTVADVPLVASSTGQAPSIDGLSLVGDASGVLVGGLGTGLDQVDATLGQVVWHSDLSGNGSWRSWGIVRPYVLVQDDSGAGLLATNNGSVIASDPQGLSSFATDWCGTDVFQAGGSDLRVTTTDGVSQASAIPFDVDGGVDMTSDGILVENGGLQLVTWDGATAWTVPASALDTSGSYELGLGHWLVVRDASGNLVDIDSRTGQETVPDPSVAQALADNLTQSTALLQPKDGAGRMWIEVAGSYLLKVDQAALCG